MAEWVPGPSGSGSVVLDLGTGTGALVLHTPPELDGEEIEISRIDDAERRTHSRVRQRHTPGGTQFAAVYPGLAPGDYMIWRANTSPMTVAVAAGQVTTVRWKATPPHPGSRPP
jgi:hypothetical protein